MNRKKKEKKLWKKENFSFITKIKNKQTFFLKKNKRLLYINTFFLEEREGVYFKLKYLLPYLQYIYIYIFFFF